MKSLILLTVCATLAVTALPSFAQDAAATPEVATTENTPVSVEIAIGGLNDDAKFSAASAAAETATEARIVFVSDLQTGPTNASLDQLRDIAADKKESLDQLREKLAANADLSAMIQDQAGDLDHVIAAALDQNGMLLIFVDDEHQM